MNAYKLEKDIILYKVQFDKYCLDLFQEHKLDRLSLDVDGLMFRIKYMIRHNKDLDKIPELQNLFTSKASQLHNCFGEFLYSLITQVLTIPDPFKLDDLEDILAKDVKIDNTYVKFKMVIISRNKEFLNYIDNSIPEDKVYNITPDEYFRFYTDSYNDGISKAYPELFENRHQDKVGTGADGDVFVHNFTFQTSERCSLNCTYCLPAGSKITMSDFSLKNIEDISIGDKILSVNEYPDIRKQHIVQEAEVTHLFTRETDGYYKITHPRLKDPICLTPEHPIKSYRYGWIPVKNLTKSDKLLVSSIDPYDFYDANTNDINYIKGYFIAAFMGDGCSITNIPSDGYLRYFNRFAVKDVELYNRIKKYSEILNINFSIIPFEVSKKHNITVDALYSGKQSEYNKIHDLYNEAKTNKYLINNPEFLMGFLAGFFDAEGYISGSILRIFNSDQFMFNIAEKALSFLHIKWDYDKPRITTNKVVMVMRLYGGSPDIFKFLKSCKPAIERKGLVNLLNRSTVTYIEDYEIEYVDCKCKVYNFETSTHTYAVGRLFVHNCYQFNKTPMRMSFETAKTFIDNLLADKYGYINRYNSPAIIIEFIGGEPLMEINLTRKIYEYFLEQCYELNHPWFSLHRVSICSNGLQYFDKEVQDFFKEYAQNISFNISIDGNKELHDACRIQPNGEGSYDIDIAALNHYNKHYTPERNSKMTLAPSNIKYLFDSVVNFIENGMTCININCVFEEGWTPETALTEYEQLKKLADYILENNLEHLYIAIFNERQEDMMSKYSDSMSCGGTGSMLSLRPNGQFYPCIRYMPTSVGNNVKDLCIGDIEHGIVGREQDSEILKMMDRCTRRSSNNDICYECPLSNDCAGCSALGHAIFGTPNKRATFICIQMIAEHLANVYYWNQLLLKHPEYNLPVRKNVVPDEWALLVIDNNELENLKLLECLAIASKIEGELK